MSITDGRFYTQRYIKKRICNIASSGGGIIWEWDLMKNKYSTGIDKIIFGNPSIPYSWVIRYLFIFVKAEKIGIHKLVNMCESLHDLKTCIKYTSLDYHAFLSRYLGSIKQSKLLKWLISRVYSKKINYGHQNSPHHMPRTMLMKSIIEHLIQFNEASRLISYICKRCGEYILHIEPITYITKTRYLYKNKLTVGFSYSQTTEWGLMLYRRNVFATKNKIYTNEQAQYISSNNILRAFTTKNISKMITYYVFIG
jgi:hypothetical protein